MDFRYGTAFAVPPPEAYERLLLDVMLGDPTLLHPHRRGRERLAVHHHDPRRLASSPTPRRPVTYVAGSWGPEAADALIARDGARWRRL